MKNLLAQRELEVTKLKETIKNIRIQAQMQERSRSGPVIALAPVNKTPMSPTNGTPKDVTKIQQLERDLANLNEVLNLHRQVEQDLNKKLRAQEKTKSKEDVNYEYVKNIFMKFLLFSAQGSAAEAKQMESLLYDLLGFTKKEREDLDKARQSKVGFLNFFSNTSQKSSVPGITGSYVPASGPTQRSQSAQRPAAKAKAGTEASFSQDIGGDFSGISSTSLNIKNYKGLQKKP